MKHIAKNTKETQKIAEDVIKKILGRKTKRKSAFVLALSGDLGSGKTHFTQGIARALGVKETVPSPTFILQRIYKIKKGIFSHLIHIDAYRLKGTSELKHIGWSEIKNDPHNIIVIEWGDKIKRALPKDAVKIHFKYTGGEQRTITIAS